MRILLTIPFVMIVFLTLSAAEARACLCASGLTVRDDYERAAGAVLGRAEGIETEPSVPVPGDMLPRRGARWVVMTVRRSFKGDVEKGERIRVRQSFFEGCEPFIAGTTGADYLLFLEEVPPGEGSPPPVTGRRFRVLPCSRSKEVKAAPDNLRIVERLSKGKH